MGYNELGTVFLAFFPSKEMLILSCSLENKIKLEACIRDLIVALSPILTLLSPSTGMESKNQSAKRVK